MIEQYVMVAFAPRHTVPFLSFHQCERMGKHPVGLLFWAVTLAVTPFFVDKSATKGAFYGNEMILFYTSWVGPFFFGLSHMKRWTTTRGLEQSDPHMPPHTIKHKCFSLSTSDDLPSQNFLGSKRGGELSQGVLFMVDRRVFLIFK